MLLAVLASLLLLFLYCLKHFHLFCDPCPHLCLHAKCIMSYSIFQKQAFVRKQSLYRVHVYFSPIFQL